MQIGDSFVEEAALLISTETPPLESFFSRQMIIRPINIREAMAASDPIRGHFILSKNVDAGGEFSSNSMLLLTKTVELTSIFPLPGVVL